MPPCAAAPAAPPATRVAQRNARGSAALRACPRRPRCRPCRTPARAAASGDEPRAGLRVLQMPSFVPKTALISAVKFGWTLAWSIMMAELAPQSRDGAYVRPTDVLVGAPIAYPAEPGRYVLYVGAACPWCHRATLTVALRRLGSAVRVVQLRGNSSSGGWEFPPGQADPVVSGAATLRDTYAALAPAYTGRRTAPLLVDSRDGGAVVSNDSATISRLLNDAFAPQDSSDAVELRPAALAAEIDALCAELQGAVNDGVYRCGFATTQKAYEAAQAALRAALTRMDARLADRRFLCGAAVTEADVRLFATVVRLDAVYSPLFKCALQTALDFPSLHAWARDVYRLPGVAAGVDLAAYRAAYYGNLFPVNPGGVVPAGPTEAQLGYGGEPPGRAELGAGAAPFHLKAAAA
jgi:putative glutathione S-transferase